MLVVDYLVLGSVAETVRGEYGAGEYFVLLNDWGSSMTFGEVAEAEQFFTHELYYDVGNMGAAQDLAALVRSVFSLTQCTFSPVKTCVELDTHMHSQWSWGGALDAALKRDYNDVERFLSSGSLNETEEVTEEVAFASLDISENS